MQRLFKTVKGSITVLVTLILVPTIFFTGFMVDLARIKLYGNQAVMTADNYGETVLTQYDNLLKELYGLFAVTQDEKALDNLDKLQGYVSSAFDPAQNNISWEHFEEVQDYLGMNTLDGFMPYQDADITLEKEFIPESHLSNHAVLDTQIGDFMRFRIAQNLLDDGSDLMDQISEVENAENDGKAIDKKLELDNEVEKLLEYAKNYYGILKEIRAYLDYIGAVNKQYLACQQTFKDLEATNAYIHYRAYVLADEEKMNVAIEKRSHNTEDEENTVEMTEEEQDLLDIYDDYINDAEAREEKFKEKINLQRGILEVTISEYDPIHHSNFESKVEDLKTEWDTKTKLEKQEFISKFIESMVLEKDEENDSFKIIKINFRSRYLDELKKLNKADCIDLAKPTEDMQGISVIKSTPRIIKSELNEYIENLKEHYDVKYYEDVYDWTHSYVQEDKMITLPREKGNERLMRAVFVDNNKSFPIKDSKGKIRGKLGAVSYREKGITDKNELDNYYEAISDLVLYKTEQTEDEEESSED